MTVPERLLATMRAHAGANAEIRIFRAPGRVNLIGEHTDYNGGFVLPTNTSIYTWLAVTARNDRRIQVRSENLGEEGQFDLDELEPGIDVSWLDYIKGVAAMLEADGIRLRGANMLIDSNIPIGAGLSSSASLELATAAALLAIAGRSLPAQRTAELCQAAEQRFARVQCGLMDQYVIACAGSGKAVLLDCHSMAATQIAIPPDMGLVIVDSGVRHRLSYGDYNNRREECESATRLLASKLPEVQTLRDLGLGELQKHAGILGDTLLRRCRHVITENGRVLDAVKALSQNDAGRLGELIDASHASLRDDFEVSCGEIEALVKTAKDCATVLGARMVGGGFGGCVLALTRSGEQENVAAHIREQFGSITGKKPWTHIVESAPPANEVQYQ